MKKDFPYMTIPEDAEEHFTTLAQEFESHGLGLDISLEKTAEEAGLLDRIRTAYDNGEVDEGEDLVRSALRRHLESEAKSRRERAAHLQDQAKHLQEEAKQMQDLLQQNLHMPRGGGSLTRPLGQNVNTIRRFLGLSKVAFSKLVDGISRPSLRAMENGTGGQQVPMVESIAGELMISPKLLFLDSSALSVLHEDCPLDVPKNEAVGVINALARKNKDMSRGALQDVTHAIELDHDHLTSRGARTGAVIGWAHGLPQPTQQGYHGQVRDRLSGAVVGAHHGHLLAKKEPGLSSSDDGFDSIASV